jgi:hypothetical protein
MDTVDLNINTRRHKEMSTRDSIIINHLYSKRPLDSLIEYNLINLKDSNVA